MGYQASLLTILPQGISRLAVLGVGSALRGFPLSSLGPLFVLRPLPVHPASPTALTFTKWHPVNLLFASIALRRRAWATRSSPR